MGLSYFRSRNFREQKFPRISRLSVKFPKVYVAKNSPLDYLRKFMLSKFFQIFFSFLPCVLVQSGWEKAGIADRIRLSLSNLPSIDPWIDWPFDDMDPVLQPSTVPSDQDQIIAISKLTLEIQMTSKSLRRWIRWRRLKMGRSRKGKRSFDIFDEWFEKNDEDYLNVFFLSDLFS